MTGKNFLKRNGAVALFSAVAGFGLLSARSAAAAPVNLVSNGNFSFGGTGSYTTLNAGDTSSLSGWSVGYGANDGPGSPTVPNAGAPGVDVITGYFPSPPGGGNSIDLDGNAPGSITSAPFGVTPNTFYTLTFEVAANTDGPPIEKMLHVALDPTAQSTNPTSLNFGSNSSTQSAHQSHWEKETVTFLTSSTATSEALTFTSLDPGSDAFSTDAFGPVIGNVSVTSGIGSSVPLPKSAGAGFGMLGAVGALIWMKRRFARKLEIA